MNYCNEKTIHDNMHLKPQHVFVCIDNKIAVDFWGKYENIQNEWEFLCKKFKTKIHLPWLNKTNDEYNSYKKIYTKQKRTLPKLIDYAVRIPPGSDSDAFCETTITWDSGSKKFKTRGLDTDQTVSAIKATEKMLNTE